MSQQKHVHIRISITRPQAGTIAHKAMSLFMAAETPFLRLRFPTQTFSY